MDRATTTTVKCYLSKLRNQISRITKSIEDGIVNETDLINCAGAMNWKDDGWTPFVSIKTKGGHVYRIEEDSECK